MLSVTLNYKISCPFSASLRKYKADSISTKRIFELQHCATLPAQTPPTSTSPGKNIYKVDPDSTSTLDTVGNGITLFEAIACLLDPDKRDLLIDKDKKPVTKIDLSELARYDLKRHYLPSRKQNSNHYSTIFQLLQISNQGKPIRDAIRSVEKNLEKPQELDACLEWLKDIATYRCWGQVIGQDGGLVYITPAQPRKKLTRRQLDHAFRVRRDSRGRKVPPNGAPTSAGAK